jgi:aryl sulfotransferase
LSEIFWLASYPKSGNTWLRMFLANLLRDDGHPVDLDSPDLARQRSNTRQIFDDAAGVEASDLTWEETERFLPQVFRHLARISPRTLFLKTHDPYTVLPHGKPLIPSDVTAGAIYVVRNPLDVAVSYARYSALPVDRIVEVMATGFCAPPDRSIGILNPRLPPWSEHVLSWSEGPPFQVHPVRYEDMHERPLETFSALARFCGLPSDADNIERALRHSSFDRLRKQEHERGFAERPEFTSAFFREGKSNIWKDVLSESQVARIVSRHGEVMRRFGYFPL